MAFRHLTLARGLWTDASSCDHCSRLFTTRSHEGCASRKLISASLRIGNDLLCCVNEWTSEVPWKRPMMHENAPYNIHSRITAIGFVPFSLYFYLDQCEYEYMCQYHGHTSCSFINWLLCIWLAAAMSRRILFCFVTSWMSIHFIDIFFWLKHTQHKDYSLDCAVRFHSFTVITN